YQKDSASRSEVHRKTGQEKTGVFTGAFVENPVTKEPLPLWTADYVMMDYGTGVIMAVPAHDSRDFEFATQFNLPIKSVIKSKDLPFEGDGSHINSSTQELDINGLDNKAAGEKIVVWLEENKKGQKKVQYKLRDWLFSRQRYWGEPFPLVRGKNGIEPVPDEELPVLLPPVADYQPSEKGESPLARVKEFVDYKDSKGQPAKRETDTMPSSAASSWYFLRYLDPGNDSQPFRFEFQKYWMPVDLYIGGTEHSVGHLLYARFWHKVLYDEGLVSHKEPFKKLSHQGVVLGEDGHRMSKSRGNGVSPDPVREEYGADALRVYILFLGPFEKDKLWSSKGIEGSRRFLDRVWRFARESKDQQQTLSPFLESSFHQTIKKVTEDIESMNFNTAVSALMIFVNHLYKEEVRDHNVAKTLACLLMPFAPHLAEEIGEFLGEKELVSLAPWPGYDKSKIHSEERTIGVQVNGKTRGSVVVLLSDSEKEAVEKALTLPAVKQALQGKEIQKVIYKPGKILNLIKKA
ncbi:MAG: class I tRNA ligase family protein, partial [Bdellovibrionales bacterium]|nr:class I tRNA ligase family protein [Bdellovibrionales bacterium]